MPGIVVHTLLGTAVLERWKHASLEASGDSRFHG